MTVDLTVAPGVVESTQRRQVALVTGPASYPTGGETLDPGDFRMGKVFIVLGGISDLTEYLMPFYDEPNGKLLWFDNGTGNEVVNGTNLTTYTGRIEVVGQ